MGRKPGFVAGEGMPSSDAYRGIAGQGPVPHLKGRAPVKSMRSAAPACCLGYFQELILAEMLAVKNNLANK